MKNETIIKEKSAVNIKRILRIILIVVFVLMSLVFGFLIAFFGKGESYVEASLFSAIITLFGFGLTSTVFVYQAFKDKEAEKIKNVIHALANTLFLTFILIIVALVFDFIGSLDFSKAITIAIQSLKYASLIYAFICQIDILRAFIIIVKNK